MTAPATRTFLSSVVVVLLFGFLSVASAHEYALAGLKIVHPWTRATPPGATTGVAYLRFVNSRSTAMRLTGATTPVAQRVEIHVMSVDGGVMRMRPEQGLDIPAQATVELKPGGIHLMLIGLSRPLTQEGMIPLTLVFGSGETFSIELYVEAIGAGSSNHDH